jgi:hypothetical protein
VTVLNAVTIYRQNIGRKVQYLKFKVSLEHGLLAKYSKAYKMTTQ